MNTVYLNEVHLLLCIQKVPHQLSKHKFLNDTRVIFGPLYVDYVVFDLSFSKSALAILAFSKFSQCAARSIVLLHLLFVYYFRPFLRLHYSQLFANVFEV
ncbi:hypothetical protein SK128_022015 [Halocaridina rubra]|uniref:Uncharacterized protein n=1 Tax=Halocaridina rubra TaxID=373956 RepID=A0AAN8WYB6_HALRR